MYIITFKGRCGNKHQICSMILGIRTFSLKRINHITIKMHILWSEEQRKNSQDFTYTSIVNRLKWVSILIGYVRYSWVLFTKITQNANFFLHWAPFFSYDKMLHVHVNVCVLQYNYWVLGCYTNSAHCSRLIISKNNSTKAW